MQGPEDSHRWTQKFQVKSNNLVEVCHKCGRGIQIWHCANGGCAWCAKCSARVNKERRRNGKS